MPTTAGTLEKALTITALTVTDVSLMLFYMAFGSEDLVGKMQIQLQAEIYLQLQL